MSKRLLGGVGEGLGAPSPESEAFLVGSEILVSGEGGGGYLRLGHGTLIIQII